MHIQEALSTQASWPDAVDEVVSHVQRAPQTASVGVLFFSPHHLEAAPQIARAIGERLGTENVIGCSAASVLGDGRECEQGPALALWTASLPESSIAAMHLQYEPQTDGGGFVGWPADVPASLPEDSVIVLLGDPFTFPVDRFLETINRDQPGVTVVGGMASAAMQPGANRLLLGGRVEPAGAVALWMQGGFHTRTIVSQGCRPIGPRFVITKAQKNLIHELSGKPALAQLQSLYPRLNEREQQLARHGLQLGRVMNEHQGEFVQGDFLIRAVLAADEQSGAISVGDLVRVGQSVQFHLRDERTAREDLNRIVAALHDDSAEPPLGGLLFTCNGRGARLFGEPDYDIGCFRRYWPELPLSGLFAAGEIGPVGGENYLHGFTASGLLFFR